MGYDVHADDKVCIEALDYHQLLPLEAIRDAITRTMSIT